MERTHDRKRAKWHKTVECSFLALHAYMDLASARGLHLGGTCRNMPPPCPVLVETPTVLRCSAVSGRCPLAQPCSPLENGTVGAAIRLHSL